MQELMCFSVFLQYIESFIFFKVVRRGAIGPLNLPLNCMTYMHHILLLCTHTMYVMLHHIAVHVMCMQCETSYIYSSLLLTFKTSHWQWAWFWLGRFKNFLSQWVNLHVSGESGTVFHSQQNGSRELGPGIFVNNR